MWINEKFCSNKMLENGLQCDESWKKSRNNFKIKIVFQHISNNQQCQPTLNQSKQLDKISSNPHTRNNNIDSSVVHTLLLFTAKRDSKCDLFFPYLAFIWIKVSYYHVWSFLVMINKQLIQRSFISVYVNNWY